MLIFDLSGFPNFLLLLASTLVSEDSQNALMPRGDINFFFITQKCTLIIEKDTCEKESKEERENI